MIALLLATLAASPNVASPSINLSGGTPSTASGIVDWSRSWSEAWPSGIPAPTISCVAAASNGDLTCTGATASKQGSPTTTLAAGYPERTAVALNGSSDYYDFGDTGDATGDFTVCAVGTFTTTAGVVYLVGKDSGSAGTRGWVMYRSGGTLSAYVAKDNSNLSSIDVGAPALGSLFVACFSYDYTTDGASILRANANGTAPSEITNAYGPVRDTALPLRIGANGAASPGATFWTGAVVQVSMWQQAMTAAQLSTLVASQQARLASKPVNAAITVTSPATTVVGTSGALYNLPANSLAVTASGAEIWGAAGHSNLLTNSQAFGSWTEGHGGAGSAAITVASDNATAPDGTLTADTLTVPSVSSGQYSIISSNSVSGDGTSRYRSLWVRGPVAGTIYAYHYIGGYVGVLTCNYTTTWTRCGSVATPASAAAMNIGVDANVGSGMSAQPAQTVVVWGASETATSFLPPYVATTSAPVSGTADAVSTATTLVNPAKWCVGVRAKPSVAWGSTTGTVYGLLALGSYPGANTASLALYNGNFYFQTRDAGATAREAVFSAGTGTSAKSIVVCATAGVLSAFIDGVAQSPSFSGAGVQPVSLPAALGIGNRNTTESWNGSILKVCQSKDFAGCRKALQ